MDFPIELNLTTPDEKFLETRTLFSDVVALKLNLLSSTWNASSLEKVILAHLDVSSECTVKCRYLGSVDAVFEVNRDSDAWKSKHYLFVHLNQE